MKFALTLQQKHLPIDLNLSLSCLVVPTLPWILDTTKLLWILENTLKRRTRHWELRGILGMAKALK